MAYVVFAFGMASALGDFNDPEITYYNSTAATPPLCSAGESIAFAPDGASSRAVVQGALEHVGSNCNVTGYASYVDMRQGLLANDSLHRATTLAAVLLDLPASSYTMLIRSLDDGDFDPSSPSGLADYAPRNSWGSPWQWSGGLLLEMGLDMAIAETHTPGAAASATMLTGNGLKTAQLPTPPFKSRYSPDSTWMLYVIPIYVTLGSTMLGMFTLRPIVVEREKRLVEGMTMMGLDARAYNNGWYLCYLLTQCLAPIVSTLVTMAIGFISWDANIGYLFITMFLRSADSIVYMHACTHACTHACIHARTHTHTRFLHTIDSIIYVLMIVPLVRASSSSELFVLILMILPGVALFVVCVSLAPTPTLTLT